jgi:hypothetical protein
MNHQLRSITFVAALVLLLGMEELCRAQSTPSGPDRAEASHAVRRPATQDARELEAALLGADPAEAVRLFWRFSCANYSNSESAEVVQLAWGLRDSSGASGATQDPVVRTLMAKCLAEAWPRFRPIEPGDAQVLAQLRLAIGSDNPEEVRAAAHGLTQTATAEDVQSIEPLGFYLRASAASRGACCRSLQPHEGRGIPLGLRRCRGLPCTRRGSNGGALRPRGLADRPALAVRRSNRSELPGAPGT